MIRTLLYKILLVITGIALILLENDVWYYDWLQYVYLGGLIIFLFSPQLHSASNSTSPAGDE